MFTFVTLFLKLPRLQRAERRLLIVFNPTPPSLEAALTALCSRPIYVILVIILVIFFSLPTSSPPSSLLPRPSSRIFFIYVRFYPASGATAVIGAVGGVKSANLEIAARRIVYTKSLNCGQVRVSPDHVLVHEKVTRTMPYFPETSCLIVRPALCSPPLYE